MPSLAPAKTVRGSLGCTVSPKTRLSLPKPLPTRRQLSPPSGLSHAPLPTVPTQIVKLPAMAVSSHSSTAVPATHAPHPSPLPASGERESGHHDPRITVEYLIMPYQLRALSPPAGRGTG